MSALISANTQFKEELGFVPKCCQYTRPVSMFLRSPIFVLGIFADLDFFNPERRQALAPWWRIITWVSCICSTQCRWKGNCHRTLVLPTWLTDGQSGIEIAPNFRILCEIYEFIHSQLSKPSLLYTVNSLSVWRGTEERRGLGWSRTREHEWLFYCVWVLKFM